MSMKLKLSLMFFFEFVSKLLVRIMSCSGLKTARIWGSSFYTLCLDKPILRRISMFLFKRQYSISLWWLDAFIERSSVIKISILSAFV